MPSRIIMLLNSLASQMRIGELSPVPFNRPLLIAGILIYAITQLLFNGYVMHDRHLAYDPSDAHTYIIKAAQIEEGCFTQDCLAIKTLQSELKENTHDVELDWLRYRAYARISLVYHPLHSVILTGLHATGLSWETAYQILLISGTILIGIGAGLLTQTMFGSNAAALTLVILAFSQFQGQGLHLVVPSNISLGLMMLSWAVIITRRERAYWWILALIVAMVTMHSAGRIYALMSLGVFFLMDRRLLTWKNIGGYCLLLLPIMAFFALPHLVSKPVLSLAPEPRGDMTYWEGVRNNLDQAFQVMWLWDGRANFEGSIMSRVSAAVTALLFPFLAYAGIRCLNGARRKMLLFILSGIAALCAASMFLVLPHYPAELFSRVWCAVAIIISGSACYAILNSGRLPYSVAPKVRRLFVGAFCVVLMLYVVYGSRTIYKTAALIKDIENVEFSKVQEDYMGANCGTMFYTSETNLLYYLTQNGLHCSSVYIPGIPDREAGLSALKTLPQPFLLFIDQPGQTTMKLKKKSSIGIQFDNYDGPGDIYLKFGGEAPSYDITILINDKPFVLKADAGQWVVLPEPIKKGDKIAIPGKLSASVYLQGLKVGKQSEKSSWPWGERIVLTYKTRVTEGYNFSFQDQTKSIFKKFDIIDSEGSSMLLKAYVE